MTDLFDFPFEDEPEPEPEPAPTPVASRRVLTVTEVTVRVRDLLETEFFEVWVEGELSNCRVWNTGHLYFTLKDASAQVRGVIFRSSLRYLKFKPEDGLRVVARGRVSIYEPKGEYQLVCEHLEPQGLGARQLAFDQLKKRLQDEGLFDASRKRPLPVPAYGTLSNPRPPETQEQLAAAEEAIVAQLRASAAVERTRRARCAMLVRT